MCATAVSWMKAPMSLHRDTTGCSSCTARKDSRDSVAVAGMYHVQVAGPSDVMQIQAPNPREAFVWVGG